MRIIVGILIIISLIQSSLLLYTVFNPVKQFCPEQKQVDCKYTDLDRIEDYLVEGRLKIENVYVSCDKSSFNNRINCYSTIKINEGNDTKKVINLNDDTFKSIIRKTVSKLNLEIP